MATGTAGTLPGQSSRARLLLFPFVTLTSSEAGRVSPEAPARTDTRWLATQITTDASAFTSVKTDSTHVAKKRADDPNLFLLVCLLGLKFALRARTHAEKCCGSLQQLVFDACSVWKLAPRPWSPPVADPKTLEPPGLRSHLGGTHSDPVPCSASRLIWRSVGLTHTGSEERAHPQQKIGKGI